MVKISTSHFTFTIFRMLHVIFDIENAINFSRIMNISYFDMQKWITNEKNRRCQKWKKYEWLFRRSVKLFYMRQLLNLWHFYPPFIMRTEQAKQNAFSYKHLLHTKFDVMRWNSILVFFCVESLLGLSTNFGFWYRKPNFFESLIFVCIKIYYDITN